MFTCVLCDKKYTRQWVLNRHLREVHEYSADESQSKPKSRPRRSPMVTCTVCRNVFKRNDIEGHYLAEHNITLKNSVLSFSSAPDFYTWKKKTEEKENVFFTKTTAQKIVSGKNKIYYRCHRSGYFDPKLIYGIRKRKTKIQGSCKINGFCPSAMKATFFENGNIEVEYCETHVGHTCDLAHKLLTFNERQDIAGKINNKIPYDTILEEVRSTFKPDMLKRIHLLTKNDLYNIKREFGLNETMRHEDREDEVRENVGEVRSLEERPSILAEVSTKTVLPSKVRPTDKLLLRQRVESILNKIDNPESLKVADQCLKNLDAKLTSLKQRNIALQVKSNTKKNQKEEP
ncbi:uncharacterized protein LOC128996145 [Macrosteles quadrilineatus]|uniref:uncharacterized protein LOC128996145 n=1 Tax=Macrosteles quadrilineatus TaxID=74068 RepID=UPI0023E0E203|nr:uncharacterized protein LOC128996145 [Macrosteles quadrilineatus]